MVDSGNKGEQKRGGENLDRALTLLLAASAPGQILGR